jgi:hypothetical protein
LRIASGPPVARPAPRPCYPCIAFASRVGTGDGGPAGQPPGATRTGWDETRRDMASRSLALAVPFPLSDAMPSPDSETPSSISRRAQATRWLAGSSMNPQAKMRVVHFRSGRFEAVRWPGTFRSVRGGRCVCRCNWRRAGSPARRRQRRHALATCGCDHETGGRP